MQMRTPLSRLQPEPPVEYIAFVASHLDRLRIEVRRAVGDGLDAEYLYPEVLMDVAVAWDRLEFSRQVLHQATPAEGYLRQSLERRCVRLRDEEDPSAVPIAVWASADVLDSHLAPIVLQSHHEPPPVPEPPRENAALRLAAQLLGEPTEPSYNPLVEAMIAWWHGYEVRRRRRLIALAAVAVALFGLGAAQAQRELNDASAPADRPAAVALLAPAPRPVTDAR